MSEQKKQNLADPSVRKRFVTYKEATELYSMGLTRIQEHAKIAGATYKMGNKVLVNTDIFEAYLEQFRIPGDYEGMVYIPTGTEEHRYTAGEGGCLCMERFLEI